MKELRNGVLKIALCSVFICIFISASMYPLIFARQRGKIHFLMSPNPSAVFSSPPDKEADIMIVWISVIKDSTYRSFAMALVAYETYYADHHYCEYHWYTNNLRGGEIYAHLTTKVYPTTKEGLPIEHVYDVTHAKIHVTMSEHQLNATVIVKGNTLFTAKFWADTSVPIESRIEPASPLPIELYLSVEAYRPTLQASVSGLEVGAFTGGHFDYVDTELYDSSLLQ